jgi:hypothetical protein
MGVGVFDGVGVPPVGVEICSGAFEADAAAINQLEPDGMVLTPGGRAISNCALRHEFDAGRYADNHKRA